MWKNSAFFVRFIAFIGPYLRIWIMVGAFFMQFNGVEKISHTNFIQCYFILCCGCDDPLSAGLFLFIVQRNCANWKKKQIVKITYQKRAQSFQTSYDIGISRSVQLYWCGL